MIGLFQPEIGRRLSGHPITDKLVLAVNFSHADAPVTGAGIYSIPEDTGLAGPGAYTSANVTYTQGINRYGRWVGFSGAGANSKFDWARSDFLPTTQGCTILMLYEKADGTFRASTAFTLNMSSAGTNRIEALVPWSDGTVYWDFGGNSGDNRVSIGGLSFGADRWVFTTGRRGGEIWQNGILRQSNSVYTTRTQSAGNPFVLGAKTADFVFSDVAHYNIFCMWARQLTRDEVLMVTADPYILWDNSSDVSTLAFLSALNGPGAGGGGNAGQLIGAQKLAHATYTHRLARGA